MELRDILFVAALALLAAFAFSTGNAAAGDASAGTDEDRSSIESVVFDDSEVSDPTCVCSADTEYLYIFLGPDEESCTVT
jgi:hypothetical protein